jgi:hypothetical protein
MPRPDTPYVAVLSGELPGALREVGRHSWIVANVRDASGAFHQRAYQWLGQAQVTDTDNPYSYFGDGEVAVHGVISGDAETITPIVACLERETRAYRDANCGCWPGPNSNTFVDGLIRACGLGIELPATAVGKDYRGPIGISGTEARTGVQVETWVGGVKIGAREGVVLDLAGLSLGVHLDPFGLEVPVGAGRFGFDAAEHRPPAPTEPDDDTWRPGDAIPHAFGAGRIAMALGYDRVADAPAAGGLSDRATARLRGRGVYGKTVGYAFGFDLDVGAGVPLGFAYGGAAYPVGLGAVLGDTGLVGAFSGVGTTGVTARVAPALELPEELRLELDVTRSARVGLYGGVVLVPDAPGRSTVETRFGTTARLGTRASGRIRGANGEPTAGAASGGFFVGLERREIVGTYWIGVAFGYEIGAGG